MYRKHLQNHSSLTLLLFFCFSFMITSCVPPVYDGTTYNLDDFINDSLIIAQGKYAIQEFEDKDEEYPLNCEFDPREDTIIDGDVLTISLYCPQRRERVYKLEMINYLTGFVICNGQLTLPEAEPILVEGLTLNELKYKIEEIYCENLKFGKIFISYRKRQNRLVTIIGTRIPAVQINEKMRLSEVLAKAGMSPLANLYKSYIVREGNKLPIDFYKLIHLGDDTQNIYVKNGDQIFIAKNSAVTVMVTGEVADPRIISLPYGHIPLIEALAMSGGILFTGDKCYIHVIRGELKSPKVYILKWKELLHEPNQSLLLMSGDVVYITETPLVQWNRFISQLQPSTNCLNSGYGTYRLYQNN
ncbi:MAG: SLBB domain-containing protein [Parachlamydiaceae bacterium]|nr:SLBB domain-containing protein [Parachlamydiaceae bacterium]